jgi:hypothetical protein
MITHTQDLHPLLDELLDTRELVLRRLDDAEDAALAAWRNASQDARALYAGWRSRGGAQAHAAYLAAEDQADAALASLRAASDAA